MEDPELHALAEIWVRTSVRQMRSGCWAVLGHHGGKSVAIITFREEHQARDLEYRLTSARKKIPDGAGGEPA